MTAECIRHHLWSSHITSQHRPDPNTGFDTDPRLEPSRPLPYRLHKATRLSPRPLGKAQAGGLSQNPSPARKTSLSLSCSPAPTAPLAPQHSPRLDSMSGASLGRSLSLSEPSKYSSTLALNTPGHRGRAPYVTHTKGTRQLSISYKTKSPLIFLSTAVHV